MRFVTKEGMRRVAAGRAVIWAALTIDMFSSGKNFIVSLHKASSRLSAAQLTEINLD
jgi:hypothetical protein